MRLNIVLDFWEVRSYDLEMKLLSVLCLGLLISTTSYAETVMRCKRRDLFVPSSYQWVEILRLRDGSLQFQYGIGVDTQMLELDFSSSITEVEPNHFIHQEPSYSLDAIVKNAKMSFTIKANNQSTGGKNFNCSSL